MSRYLVTGCAGFIGSHLTDALLARGDEVVGVDAFTDYYARDAKESNLERALGEGLSFCRGRLVPGRTLTDPGQRGRGLSPRGTAGGPRQLGDSFAHYVRDNIVASQRLFEMAAPKRLRVVMASSSSVYGNAPIYPTREDASLRPVSPYGVTEGGLRVACPDVRRVLRPSHRALALFQRLWSPPAARYGVRSHYLRPT